MSIPDMIMTALAFGAALGLCLWLAIKGDRQ